MKKIVFTLAVIIGVATSGLAQLVSFDFTGATGDQVSQPTASSALNLSASSLSRGSGVTAAAAANSISSSGWSTGAIDLNDYYSFTLTPDAGFSLDLGTLSFAERRSGTGIRDFVIRTSLDGFTADVFSASVPDDTATRDQSFVFDSGFDAVTSAITIRIYGYNAESGAGTWRLNNNSVTSNMQLTGTVTAVPEPHEYAIAMAGLLLAVVVMRRRAARA